MAWKNLAKAFRRRSSPAVGPEARCRRTSPFRLEIEELERRLAPVVGSTAALVQPGTGFDGVVWVPNDGGLQVPGTLFGLPVITTEKVPGLGTKGDCCLIDPQLYVIGDRMQVEIAASEHVNFLKNQLTWRIVERLDGQPWLEKPITLQDGTSTVSPFVVLN